MTQNPSLVSIVPTTGLHYPTSPVTTPMASPLPYQPHHCLNSSHHCPTSLTTPIPALSLPHQSCYDPYISFTVPISLITPRRHVMTPTSISPSHQSRKGRS
ncbi:unnamed protein product [Cuscuta epithymum]|uniref:Uncharacterized protein n=1 Tax=Cuscuta epithymum TaxID=186058 RepID=A0AAV0BY34_9ASTE|nr:unnamed protein product [Cuscuta epithymum]